MKAKNFFLATLLVVLTSCSISELNSYRELYKKTDYFVEQLNTTYESYGILGITKYEQFTPDGKYKIAPTGRLINVRIEDYNATREDYEELKKDLSRHYKNDLRVNDVYICGGGTVMIDCRR